MLFRFLFIALIALFGVIATSGANAATIVFSEDFSSINGGTYNSGASMGNWTVDSGSVDLVGSYFQAPVSGKASVDMDGNAPGSISQILSLDPGNYKLTFSLSGNPDVDGLKSLLVSIGGMSQSFFYDTNATNNTRSDMKYAEAYLLFSISGLATESERTLLFKSLSDSPSSRCGAVIGAIQIVSSVPLPQSFWLFFVALVGGGSFAFLRRRLAI